MRHWNNGTDHRHSKSCCDKSSPARRTINGRLGRYYSGARIITLIPTRDIEEIPDFMDISTMGRTFTVRLMVKGLLPRCHNCRVRGHLQRECAACSRCKSNDHATADHPRDARESFASKLRQSERQVDFFCRWRRGRNGRHLAGIGTTGSSGCRAAKGSGSSGACEKWWKHEWGQGGGGSKQ